jgi:hypothetical protein
MLLGCEIAQPSSATPIQNQDTWGTGVNTCALYKSVRKRRKFNGPFGQFLVNGAFRIIQCQISQLLLYFPYWFLNYFNLAFFPQIKILHLTKHTRSVLSNIDETVAICD